MNEDFVTYELAVKLKERGFNCMYPIAMYNERGVFHELYTSVGNMQYYDYDDFDERDTIAPTISQVLKWLREEQGYNVNMRIYSPDGWYWTIQDRDGNYCCSHLTLSDDLFETYEQAALAGISYVLDNLI